MVTGRWILSLLCAGLLASAQPVPSLRSLAEARNLQIGAAVDPRLLAQEPQYAQCWPASSTWW